MDDLWDHHEVSVAGLNPCLFTMKFKIKLEIKFHENPTFTKKKTTNSIFKMINNNNNNNQTYIFDYRMNLVGKYLICDIFHI